MLASPTPPPDPIDPQHYLSVPSGSHQQRMSSLPTTPPNLVSGPPSIIGSVSSHKSTNSDDSELFELSFDYEVDSNGQVVRLNKRPSGSRHSPNSNTSSPPTPAESRQNSPIISGAKVKDRRAATPDFSDGSPLPQALASKSRRASLSRSESMPGPALGTSVAPERVEEYPRPVSTGPSAANARSFQRAVSTPSMPLNQPSLPPSSTAPRAATSSSSKYSRPLRVNQDQYNEALRQERQDEYRWPDEKENLDDGGDYLNQHQHHAYEPPRRSSPPRDIAPPQQQISYHYSRPTSASQSHVTPVGPQRAYLNSGSSITPGGPRAVGNTAARMLKKKLTIGFGVGRISEVDTPSSSGIDTDYAEGTTDNEAAPEANGWISETGAPTGTVVGGIAGVRFAPGAMAMGRQRAPSASVVAMGGDRSPSGLGVSANVRPRRSSEGDSEFLLFYQFDVFSVSSTGACISLIRPWASVYEQHVLYLGPAPRRGERRAPVSGH